jgi:hypothetical protein
MSKEPQSLRLVTERKGRSAKRTQPPTTAPSTGAAIVAFLALLLLSSNCSGSDCDSPFRLSNFTLDHLDEKWASEIDFVVCELE